MSTKTERAVRTSDKTKKPGGASEGFLAFREDPAIKARIAAVSGKWLVAGNPVGMSAIIKECLLRALPELEKEFGLAGPQSTSRGHN